MPKNLSDLIKMKQSLEAEIERTQLFDEQTKNAQLDSRVGVSRPEPSLNSKLAEKAVGLKAVDISTSVIGPQPLPFYTEDDLCFIRTLKRDQTASSVVSIFEKIWDEASKEGRRAAVRCVPTPMGIVDLGIYREGECGGASIPVESEHPFSRWLVEQKLGSARMEGFVSLYFSVKTQSLERAMAYATAFAAVLFKHGIESLSIQRLID